MAQAVIPPSPAPARHPAANAATFPVPFAVAAGVLVFALAAPRLVLGPVVALAALAAVLVVAGARIPSLATLARFGERQRLLVLSTMALSLYLLASVLWAPDRINGLGKAALFVALAALLAGVSIVAARVPAPAADRFGRALLGGLGVGAVFLLFEEASGHLIKNFVFSLVPALKPDARHLSVDADMGERVQAYVTNRSVAVLVLVLWPAAALCDRVLSRDRARLVTLALGAVTIATAVLSVHASSRLALMAGVAIYIATRVFPRQALLIAVTAWLALTLLMVPVASQLYARGLHLDERVPYSFRARIILWNYTADRITERFWRGVGIDGTKPLDRARNKQWETRPGHVYPQRTGEHAHNFYIQMWNELGALGVGVFSLFGVALLWSINRLPGELRAAGFAAFLTAAALGATSWGIWQPWLMGANGLAALLFVLAAARAGQAEPVPVPRPALPPSGVATS